MRRISPEEAQKGYLVGGGDFYLKRERVCVPLVDLYGGTTLQAFDFSRSNVTTNNNSGYNNKRFTTSLLPKPPSQASIQMLRTDCASRHCPIKIIVCVIFWPRKTEKEREREQNNSNDLKIDRSLSYH